MNNEISYRVYKQPGMSNTYQLRRYVEADGFKKDLGLVEIFNSRRLAINKMVELIKNDSGSK